MHIIHGVQPESAAYRYGLRPGDTVVSMNGEPLLDEIDYQALSVSAHVNITVIRANGVRKSFLIHKAEGEPLGLRFGQSMSLAPRLCRNRCVFCFVDQMPGGFRNTLYVKDDDWRCSLMMGCFVTMTNVDESEFQRILRRKASPLFISVQATDPELRRRMMGNHAGDIMPRLERLAGADLRFHCQIVVCPGINDRNALMDTLEDLQGLAPAAASVALVPVGLTRHREGLAALTPFDRDSAKQLLAGLAPFQDQCRRVLGTTFVFPSDEFFCLAEEPLPADEWYEGYPQVENGVGLLRLFESELEEAERFDDEPCESPRQRLAVVTGVYAAPHIRRLAERFVPEGTQVTVFTIRNLFFGETVTVAGLLTGGDILAQLPRDLCADRLLLSASMLRHGGDCFLDDMTLSEFKVKAPCPVELVAPSGQDFYDALRARLEIGE